MQLPLSTQDPDIAAAINAERQRQQDTLGFIASENIVSPAVLEASGSVLTNKYSEGYPGKRYYAGNAHVDAIESLAIARAKQLFGAEHANVQPHAGSPANAAAYMALCQPGDTIMAMDLAHGGHLTHGSGVNFSGKLYKFVHYGVQHGTERLDLDAIRALALAEKPRVIVAGATAYPRTIDFAAFRAIADEVGAYLMVDMAHIAGLVAAKLHPDPVAVADVVTFTTHKTLRGPRGGAILCRADDRLRPDDKKNLVSKIDSAVFPGLQGGPLDHAVAAKAVAFAEASRPEFVTYQHGVIASARALGEALAEAGIRIVTGGTDNHLLLADVTPLGIGGKLAQTSLEAAGIVANMNLVPFDERKPMDPSGIRLGSALLTSRGMGEAEMRQAAGLIVRVLRNPEDTATITAVRDEVRQLTARFPLPY